MSQLYATGGQSFEASASVLPMNIQSWIPLGLTGWSSLLFKGLSRVFFSTTVWKHHFLNAQASLWSNSHISTGEKNSLLENVYWTYVYYMTTGKTITLTIFTFVGKVMSLFFFFFFFFNTMPNYIIAFLLRSIYFFNIMAAGSIHGDFGDQENKVFHCFHFFPIYLSWSDGTGCHIREAIRQGTISGIISGETDSFPCDLHSF